VLAALPLATPTDRARLVRPTSLAERVNCALRDLAEVTEDPFWRQPDGRLRFLVERRPATGTVVVSIKEGGLFCSSERDALEAAQTYLARTGLRVRFRLPQSGVRASWSELLVLPIVVVSR
jgi:hypothetical protein